jgi:hypothetical protein
MLGGEISVAKAHGMQGHPSFRHHLEVIRLLEDGEWDAMFPKDRHTTVWMWCFGIVGAMSSSGLIGQSQQLLCGNAISAIRAQANDLLSCLDRDLPYPYVHLVTVLVKLLMLVQLLDFALSPETDVAEDPSSAEEVGVILLLMGGVFLTVLGLQGITDLHAVLHNPFGPRRIDVAHVAIFADLRALSVSLLQSPPDRGSPGPSIVPPHSVLNACQRPEISVCPRTVEGRPPENRRQTRGVQFQGAAAAEV